jgi:glycosyltransferase 2 family protein
VGRSLRIALLLCGLALFVFLCRHVGLGELFAAVERANPPRFLVFLALSAAVFLAYAKRWSIVLDAMGAGRPRLSLGTLLCFRAAEHAVSTLLPTGHLSGEPVRALLLRRRGRDWSRSISTVTMDRMLEASASSIIGPIYVAVFFLANGVGAVAAPWVMGGMILCLAMLGLFYLHLYQGATLISFLARRGYLPTIRGSLETIEADLRAFVRTPRFATSLAVAFLTEALVIAELWMLARAFALPISLPTLLGVIVGMGVAQLLPIPAALGSLEAAGVGIVSLAGGPAPLGLAVALLVRLRETLWILVGLLTLYVEGLASAGLRVAENTSAIVPKG